MFHRILADEWQRGLTITSFTIFMIVFTITVIRVMRLPKKTVNHLENLPLQNDEHSLP